jgi:hypothetical protein
MEALVTVIPLIVTRLVQSPNYPEGALIPDSQRYQLQGEFNHIRVYAP